MMDTLTSVPMHFTVTPMNSTLPVEHGRALSDLLADEREMRARAEATSRELRQLLLELAVRFDGVRLEAIRRKDPSLPAFWTPDEWRAFFAQVEPLVQPWRDPDAARRERDLLQQIEELKSKMQAAKQPESRPPALGAEQEQAAPVEARQLLLVQESARVEESSDEDRIDLPAEATPCLADLVADVRNRLPSLPKSCPAAFRKALDGNGRKGADLARAYQRYWIALYLIGHWRLNAQLEIADVLACISGASPGSGSLRRILDDLGEKGFVIAEKLALSAPRSALKLLRLSPDGARLFEVLFSQPPLETDWERLIRLHEGERFPEHTLAVLIFALHARKRGWATQVLPPVDETNAIPDLRIWHSEQHFYVEVELGQKENPAKWRNQAELNGGKVALCAATPATRQRLTGDCRLDHLSGLATDLETLVKVKYATIHAETPLWLEEW